jgi:hypothetical protein
MPIIKPNLADVVSNDPPVGTWPATITEVTDKVSGAGNPMLVVRCAMEVDGQKYELSGFHVYTGRAAYSFENLLRATHFDDVADQLRRGQPLDFNTDNLLHQPVQVTVEEGVDQNGQKRKNIKAYSPV